MAGQRPSSSAVATQLIDLQPSLLRNFEGIVDFIRGDRGHYLAIDEAGIREGDNIVGAAEESGRSSRPGSAP